MLLAQKTALSGRTGDVRELLHTFISIESPRQKWVYDRIPPISISFALAEVVWIINGEEHSEVINYWNPKLAEFAGDGDTYYGAYGKRIFSLAQLKSEYIAYNNIMLIIAAYVAKKLHHNDLVDELICKCENEAYIAMWNRWANK